MSSSTNGARPACPASGPSAIWSARPGWRTRRCTKASSSPRAHRRREGRASARPSKVPGCTYCWPQVASVGMTEAKAKASGRKIKVGRFPFIGNGKAIALGEAEGLVKTVFDAETGELLGAHMIGAEVTELIQGYTIADRRTDRRRADAHHLPASDAVGNDAKHATFMIMGDTCTRACAFCNVKTGLPGALDPHEPEHVAEAWAKLGLAMSSSPRSTATISPTAAPSISRDHPRHPRRAPGTTIEVLTPDFLRKDGALESWSRPSPTCSTTISKPCRRLYLTIRPGARYFHSLRLLQRVKELDPRCSPSPASWSGWARSATKSAGDGRPALRRRRFPHHRPVSAADPQARTRSSASCRPTSSEHRADALYANPKAGPSVTNPA
jgi:hypothetical protein